MGKVTKAEAIYLLWNQGVLKWKLRDYQKPIHDSISSAEKDIVTLLIARRYGKSHTLCLMASELCLQQENTIVKYICPEKKMVRTIIEPILREIFKDCPDELRPELKIADGRFLFANGSQIQFAGSDKGNAESLRGGVAHMCIVDEAGFCDDLEYVINSILAPTLDTTNGKIILASTPSKESNHEFITKFVNPADIAGELIKYTIYENKSMTPEKIAKIIKRYPEGIDSSMFRREYLCEIMTDTDRAVIPEFTKEIQDRIIKEWTRPVLYDCYVGMDIGFKDFTVCLFAYYDFLNAKLVVCDELVLNGPTLLTPNLAKEIRKKEIANFSDNVTKEVFKPTRVSDNNNLILLQDLHRLHDVLFLPSAKDNKEAAINNLRDMIANEKIIITPNCKTLIAHLKHATWNKNRSSFDRATGFGHYDACFLPGNKVITSSGMKNIENVEVGDEVLTHLGNYKKVNKLIKSDYVGKCFDLKFAGRESISCTEDHEFYASLAEIDTAKVNIGRLKTGEFSWIPANKLLQAETKENHHRAIFPKIIPSKDVLVTKEMCFLYGYYVAEGNVSGNGCHVEFAGHKDEVNVLSIIEKAVIDTYGHREGLSRRSLRRHELGQFKPRKVNCHITNSKDNNGRKLIVNCTPMNKELKLLGKSKNKKFPDFIHNLNEEQAYYMLSGYLFGDGCFTNKTITACSISENIIYGIEILSNICGMSGNIRLNKRGGKYMAFDKLIKDIFVWTATKKDSIKLVNYIKSKEDLSFIYENKRIEIDIEETSNQLPTNYKKLRSKNEFHYEGPVYTLQVEDDASYTINGVAVKNCDSLTYLTRNVRYNRNPYRDHYGKTPSEWHLPKTVEKSPTLTALKTIFKRSNNYK